MFRLYSLPIVFSLGLALVTEDRARAADESGLEKLKDGFRHLPTKLEFSPPDGWEVGEPRALPDGGALAIHKNDPRITVTLIWAKTGGRAVKDFFNLDPPKDGSFGIESDVLKQVFGKEMIGKPTSMKLHGRTVYRIDVECGPGQNMKPDTKLAGVLFEFFVDDDKKETWRIKVRATFPKEDREKHAKQIEDLLGRYRQGK